MPVHTRPPEAVSITLPMPVEIEEKKNRADRKWEIISAVSVGSRRPDATTALLPCTSAFYMKSVIHRSPELSCPKLRLS